MAIYLDNKNLKVINFWAGPGAGKSTAAAGLFHILKKDYKSCELVTEYPKDLVYSKRNLMFSEQDYIFAKQNHRLRRLVNEVHIAITDCPLAMFLFYIPKDFPNTFKPFVLDVFNSYNNINIFIERNHQYDPKGRNQTEKEAIEIDEKILKFLFDFKINFISIKAKENTCEEVFNKIKDIL